MKQGHKYTCLMEGALLGASIGAIAGFLVAPRAEKTIKKAASLYSGAHDKTEQAIGRAAESAGTKLNRVKEILGRA